MTLSINLYYARLEPYSVQLRTLFLKVAGLIRLKLFESAISPEHCGIEGQNCTPLLISLSLLCTRSLEVM